MTTHRISDLPDGFEINSRAAALCILIAESAYKATNPTVRQAIKLALSAILEEYECTDATDEFMFEIEHRFDMLTNALVRPEIVGHREIITTQALSIGALLNDQG